jgi:hypothetical protein
MRMFLPVLKLKRKRSFYDFWVNSPRHSESWIILLWKLTGRWQTLKRNCILCWLKDAASWELHCSTHQCHSVYGESALNLNFPHTEPTQNGFSYAEPTQYEIPLTQSWHRMSSPDAELTQNDIPSRRVDTRWESPHAEHTQNEIPLTQSIRRMRFPHAESIQNEIPSGKADT